MVPVAEAGADGRRSLGSDSSAWPSSDLKAAGTDEACTLPEASGSAPQEIDPAKENDVLFTYSVRWEVGGGRTRSTVSAVNERASMCAGQRGEVGVSVGHLPDHERRPDSLVLHR